MTSRRSLLLGAGATWGAACAGRLARHRPSIAQPDARVAAVEASLGGRVGVFAFELGSGDALAHRSDERFAMCSTFKALLAAAVLARVDAGLLSLERTLPFGTADLIDHSPVTRAHVAAGALSIAELAAAAVVVSDNTAANLLLGAVGGPPALTAWVRGLGDPATRLDRLEPALNANVRGDLRDTTTPRSMARTLARVTAGAALAPASRERLVAWMKACTTGRNRLRARLPAAWDAGDKTGTGNDGAAGDVAIAFPPGRAPVAIAVYFSETPAGPDARDAAFARVGQIVTDTFA
ncbi:MAG TPA: class A beta-lactamase [Polyangia bacterium]|nr:class A beta-lactamase [Polyangia bacterium]